ncbi:MAG: TetR/AcrR family transcriptional regulator [Anaeroplasmataceae bacterium]
MKDRIICESINSLRQEGLKFSVDTLAKRLNISKKTIYKYFPNKESLALELYQTYYTDILSEAKKLVIENTKDSQKKLLFLYYDAKIMTCRDVFNKYKLNESLYRYTTEHNNDFWEIISSTMDDKDKVSLRIIVDGTFEKICNEKIAPNDVIDRLVNILW